MLGLGARLLANGSTAESDLKLRFSQQTNESASPPHPVSGPAPGKGRPGTFDRARIVSLRKEGIGATEIAKAVGCKALDPAGIVASIAAKASAGRRSPSGPLAMNHLLSHFFAHGA